MTASIEPSNSPNPNSPDPIAIHAELSDGQQAQVRSLLDAATEADDVAPVSEHVLLKLRAVPDDHGRHLLLGPGQTAAVGSIDSGLIDSGSIDSVPVRGYAYLEDTQVRDVELVVHPAHRRAGRGRALLEAATAGTGPGGVRVWSHGDQPGARALARALGYQVVRTLLQLRRPLDGPDLLFAVPNFPPGVTLRSFRPGIDDDEWLRLNARAFAHHPEQGQTTLADLQARMEEPWFDPEGLLIAQRDGAMIGFHWTKVHPGRLGEVYVLGVDPDLHGAGLGLALTLAGLRYLADQGLRTVLLYVESDNVPALALYRRLGFTSWSTDVMYASPTERPASAE